MHTTDPLTVGEIARRSGFAESAVRYYERLGLLPATRTAGGQRRFERNTLRRLAFIRAAAISSRLSPTLLAARMKASRRRVLRSKRRCPPAVLVAGSRPSRS